MRSFFTAGLIVVAAAAEVQQRGGDVGTPLYDVLLRTNRSFFDSNPVSWAARFPAQSFKEQYYQTRTPGACNFPLDIVILQDLTDSFSDNINEMKNKQLHEMVEGLRATHPNSRFAMVSFQDKPIYPLGNRDDACWSFSSDLSADLEPLYDAYARAVSYGGADAPENHFGAILAAMNSKSISWSSLDSEYARLIVVVTDAGPHHAQDGKNPSPEVLKPFGGEWTDDEAEELCTATYYPSAQQMYDQIFGHQTYVAALVFDGDWANGWPAKSWKAFSKFLDQPEGMVQPDAEDSSLFWAGLSRIIEGMESVECGPPSTPTPTTAPTTTPYPTTTTAVGQLTTTLPHTGSVTTAGPPVSTVRTTTECADQSVITDMPCVPGPDNCFCQPEVIIQIAKKPDEFNLVADDQVLA